MARLVRTPGRLGELEAGQRAQPIDWSHFGDGRWWELHRGVDFQQRPRAAMQAARMWAFRHDHEFHCRVHPGHIELWMQPR